MSLPELVLAAIALVVGVPAIRWNATAGALVASWAFGYVLFWLFAYRLTTSQMVYCDWAVIGIIMAKPEACSYRPYRGLRHQLQCIFLERTAWDRAVMALFGLAWVFYAAPVSELQRWWALWVIAAAQFAAAGGEAFVKWRADREAKAGGRSVPDNPSAGLEFARPAEAWGYG